MNQNNIIIYFIFVLILILSSINGYAQEDSYEQIAFDYFFQHIFEKEFPQEKKMQFKGVVEKEKSRFFSFVPSCFKNNKDDFKMRLSIAASNSNAMQRDIFLNSNSTKIYFKKRKTKYKLYVYRETQFGNNHYILIVVSFKTGEQHFLIELENNGNITKWCKTGVIY